MICSLIGRQMKKQNLFIYWGVFFMGRSKHTIEQKVIAVQMLKEGTHTWAEISEIYQISTDTLYQWQRKYETSGLEGLKESSYWKAYSKELMEAAVLDYLNHGLSKGAIVLKYEISSRSVLSRWIRKYTSHSELKDSGKGMSQTMTKGRKTTVEERIDIAKACLANGKNYQEVATQYEVSYQQVYQWVRKLEEGGEEALQDRRGRTKPEEERTPEDELRLKIQQIERENECLRAENLLLKKLEEIERRRR